MYTFYRQQPILAVTLWSGKHYPHCFALWRKRLRSEKLLLVPVQGHSERSHMASMLLLLPSAACLKFLLHTRSLLSASSVLAVTQEGRSRDCGTEALSHRSQSEATSAPVGRLERSPVSGSWAGVFSSDPSPPALPTGASEPRPRGWSVSKILT